jgi:hypothetical protein
MLVADAEQKGTSSITLEEHLKIHKKWVDKIQDLFMPEIPTLPPLRLINHKIPLKNPNLRTIHRAPKCPELLRDEFWQKFDRYVKAGWWVHMMLPSSVPLLIVFKKSGAIRTVIDTRQCNENTIPDVTPLPNQEAVRNNVMHARFRTKIDLSDAFKQICICPEHEKHTVFATIYGNMYSQTMQQGDKNCPATFQRLMNNTFSDVIGVFVHCYEDDIFVYSNTLEEHEEHLRWVFDQLREHKLFLSSNLKKIDLLSTWMDCLGFFVNDKGIHLDPSKIDKITSWRMPHSYHDVQKFVGVIQYIAQFLPNITDFTSLLTGMCSNNRDFVWTGFQDDCFQKIKELVAKAPACQPIDSKSSKKIWVISDASATGVGAWYGQGPTWDTCRPAGFISRKFTPAQMNYCTWEQELLGVLEALLRWEDKLLGLPFTIVMDHQALTFFNEAPMRSQRRMRWWEYVG